MNEIKNFDILICGEPTEDMYELKTIIDIVNDINFCA